MQLKYWIADFGGAKKLALKMDVTPHAVRHWIRRKVVPRPKRIKLLVTLSRGKLTPASILNDTMKKPIVSKKRVSK